MWQKSKSMIQNSISANLASYPNSDRNTTKPKHFSPMALEGLAAPWWPSGPVWARAPNNLYL